MREQLNLHSRVDRPLITLQRLAIALPLAFLVHVAEEAPGILQWLNARVEQDASMHLYVASGAAIFVITVAVAHLLSIARDRLAATIALAWIGFAIFGNAVYHILGTVADRAYVPGVVTAVMLYLPISALLVRATVIECRMPAWAAIGVLVAGGIPLYIHAVRVVFEGRRLF
jgi:hypothetical protein